MVEEETKVLIEEVPPVVATTYRKQGRCIGSQV